MHREYQACIGVPSMHGSPLPYRASTRRRPRRRSACGMRPDPWRAARHTRWRWHLRRGQPGDVLGAWQRPERVSQQAMMGAGAITHNTHHTSHTAHRHSTHQSAGDGDTMTGRHSTSQTQHAAHTRHIAQAAHMHSTHTAHSGTRTTHPAVHTGRYGRRAQGARESSPEWPRCGQWAVGHLLRGQHMQSTHSTPHSGTGGRWAVGSGQ